MSSEGFFSMNIEQRFSSELRAKGRKLEGYAAIFGTEARVSDFREVIRPGAFKASLAGDVLALADHDPAKVLARTRSGTLRLAEDMVAGADGDDKDATIAVTVNPYFAEMYAAGSVNLLDLAKRAELSRPVSKALHRFATSHRGEWRGHFLTLAAAINLDLEQPQKQIRRQISLAMQPTAVIIWVPLIRASPSLPLSTTGVSPAAASASPPLMDCSAPLQTVLRISEPATSPRSLALWRHSIERCGRAAGTYSTAF